MRSNSANSTQTIGSSYGIMSTNFQSSSQTGQRPDWESMHLPFVFKLNQINAYFKLSENKLDS